MNQEGLLQSISDVQFGLYDYYSRLGRHKECEDGE